MEAGGRLEITAEQMAIYRAAARKRQQQKRDRLLQRHALGCQIAQQAANLLKQEFQAEKVVLFGSMRSAAAVHERSDVDLAVWGLQPQAYFRAVGRLQGLDPDVSIDLIEAESAPSRLLAEILAEGIVL